MVRRGERIREKQSEQRKIDFKTCNHKKRNIVYLELEIIPWFYFGTATTYDHSLVCWGGTCYRKSVLWAHNHFLPTWIKLV